jgi:hypothetical protein
VLESVLPSGVTADAGQAAIHDDDRAGEWRAQLVAHGAFDGAAARRRGE